MAFAISSISKAKHFIQLVIVFTSVISQTTGERSANETKSDKPSDGPVLEFMGKDKWSQGPTARSGTPYTDRTTEWSRGGTPPSPTRYTDRTTGRTPSSTGSHPTHHSHSSRSYATTKPSFLPTSRPSHPTSRPTYPRGSDPSRQSNPTTRSGSGRPYSTRHSGHTIPYGTTKRSSHTARHYPTTYPRGSNPSRQSNPTTRFGSDRPHSTRHSGHTIPYGTAKHSSHTTRHYPTTNPRGSDPSWQSNPTTHSGSDRPHSTRHSGHTYGTTKHSSHTTRHYSTTYPRGSDPSWQSNPTTRSSSGRPYSTRHSGHTYGTTKRSSRTTRHYPTTYPRGSDPSWQSNPTTRSSSGRPYSTRHSGNTIPYGTTKRSSHTTQRHPTANPRGSDPSRQSNPTTRSSSDRPYSTRHSGHTYGTTKHSSRTTRHYPTTNPYPSRNPYSTRSYTGFRTTTQSPSFKRSSYSTGRHTLPQTPITTSVFSKSRTPPTSRPLLTKPPHSTKAAPQSCPVSQTSTNRGIFTWPETQADTNATVACPHDVSATATRHCMGRGRSGKVSWKPADTKACPLLKKNSMEIFDTSESNVNSSNVVNVGAKIRKLSSPKNKLIPDDVANTATVLERIVKVKGKANEVADSVLDTVDNILDANDETVVESQRETDSSTRIVHLLTDLLEQLNTTKGGSFKRALKNFAVDVSTVNPRSFTGLSFTGASVGRPGNVTKQQNGNVSSLEATTLRFPETLFEDIDSTSPQTLVVTLYKKRKLFKLKGSKGGAKNLNTYIMAGRIKNETISNLKNPVVLTFGNLKKGKKDSAECVFWNFDKEEWSSDGCQFKGYEDDGKAVCHCDHMTNFAMLMDTSDFQDAVHDEILSIVSYIGCVLSLIGLILTMCTIVFFRDLRNNTPTQILLNFCIALSLTLIVFLAAAERSKTSSMVGCRVAAIALHYFVLATFMWMVMEAINMYLAFVKVMPSYVPRFMLKCIIASWGIPAVVVGITAGLAYDYYGDDKYCRLDGTPFVIAFLIPVFVILLGNTMAFFFIFRSLLSTGKKVAADVKITRYQRARHGAAVFIILGLTWMFGIFAIEDARLVFQYLFCIFNSLQGLLVFVFYCVLPQSTRDKYKRFLGVHRRYRISSTSTKTSTIGENRSRADSHEGAKHEKGTAVDVV